MIIFKSKNRLLVVATILLMGIHSLNNVFKALIISNMTDAAINSSMHKFMESARIGIVGFILFMIVGLFMVESKTKLVKKLNLSIKETMIEDIVYHSENQTNDLSFMTNDLKQLETKGFEAELSIVQLSFIALFSLGTSLYYNIWVTLTFVIGSIAPAVLSMVYQKKIKRASNKWTQSNASYTNRLKDYLNGIETVRTYQVEGLIIKKTTREAEKMEDSLRNMNKTTESLSQYVMTIINIFSFIMPYGIGVYLIIQGDLGMGSFLAIVQLSNTIINPLLQIMELTNGYTTTSSIRERYYQAINRIKNKAETNDNQNIPEFSSVKLNNITVERDGNILFSNVNLSIHKNDNILVVGPSGTGKSSLLRVIQQTLPLSEGRYLYNEEEYDKGLMEQFSLIRQQPLIFNDSIRYNITLGDNFTDEEVIEAVKLAQLKDVVLKHGLDYSVGDNGQNLSGGQLQRIEIARAIIRKRPIILADEMTSALDGHTASAVREVLLQLPCTVVEVAHKVTKADKEKYTQIWDLGSF